MNLKCIIFLIANGFLIDLTFPIIMSETITNAISNGP